MTPRERGFAYCAIRAYTGLLYVGIVPLFSDFRDKVRNMDLQAGLYRHYKDRTTGSWVSRGIRRRKRRW